MHTTRPPALSPFYRVSPPHLHPVMAVLYMPASVLIPNLTCQPAGGAFIGNVLLTPRADPQMASLTMTNHLVGSFTCPLNPIFGSIREQIKYLCCLLEVQGFISLCDCSMLRLGEPAILRISTLTGLLLGSVSKCLWHPKALYSESKRKWPVSSKVCWTLLLAML